MEVKIDFISNNIMFENLGYAESLYHLIRFRRPHIILWKQTDILQRDEISL